MLTSLHIELVQLITDWANASQFLQAFHLSKPWIMIFSGEHTLKNVAQVPHPHDAKKREFSRNWPGKVPLRKGYCTRHRCRPGSAHVPRFGSQAAPGTTREFSGPSGPPRKRHRLCPTWRKGCSKVARNHIAAILRLPSNVVVLCLT